jgi:hypothetical protein
VNLSYHGVAANAMAEQARDLACGLALHPMQLQLLDFLVRPRHRSLVRQTLIQKHE